MTMWTPEIDTAGGPLYLALAEAIADAVDRGDLAPGQRLPTQRKLASRLGIALTTVTRGYREAERRGLLRGEVGRGTFVSGGPPGEPAAEAEGPVDLRPNTLLPGPLFPELQESLAALAREPRFELYDYGPHAGSPAHREAGASWLGCVELEVSGEEVLVTSGGQHAMLVALAAITEPGDVLLVEEVTYSGMKCLAGLLNLELEPLPLDGEGIVPDALRAACRKRRPAALYCMPTLQNPTSAVMSERRRQEIAGVVNEVGLAVVEDDSYGFLVPEPRRLAALCERAFYIAGTSKSILPALRIAYLRAPADLIERAESKIAASTYLASPVMAEAMTRWISDGTAERVMRWKRDEAQTRQALAARLLNDWQYAAHERSPHGWLTLPQPWSARQFAYRAAERGVRVTPADVFAVGRDNIPHAVRICIGPARSRSALERGLEALVATLAAEPEPIEVVI